jgi:Zn-dependent protease with chaperone function
MDQADARAGRLNLFAFPSETDLLFNLFLLAALMSSVNVALYLYGFAVRGSTSAPILVERVKYAETESLAGARRAQLVDQLKETALVLLVAVAMPATVLVSGFFLYRKHPASLRRRIQLRPLDRSTDPLFYDQLIQLCRASGISPIPSFEMSKSLMRIDAQAFGTSGRLCLRLGGGLRLLCRKEPDRFRAIVLHEIGHIANGDVPRSYFSAACWKSFVYTTVGLVVLVLPLSAIRRLGATVNATTWSRAMETIGSMIWIGTQVAVSLAVVAAIRAALLRKREFYADARAASLGASVALENAFRAQPPPIPGWKDLIRLWRLHPSVTDRLAILSKPERLSSIESGLPLLLGFLVALCGPGIFTIVSTALNGMVTSCGSLVPDGPFSLTSFQQFDWVAQFRIVAFTLIAALGIIVAFASLFVAMFWTTQQISRAFALPIQRMVVVRLLTNVRSIGRYRTLWLTAVLFAVGLEAGYRIVPMSQLPAGMPSLWFFPYTATVIGLSLIYLRFFSKRILAHHIGDTFPAWKIRVLTWANAIVLILSIGFIILERSPRIAPDSSTPAQEGVVLPAFQFFFLFAASLVTLVIVRLFAPLKCPSCRAHCRLRNVLGHNCAACGRALAPWPLETCSSRAAAPEVAAAIIDPQLVMALPPLRSRMAIASMIIGLISLVLSPCIFVWPFSVPAGLVAITFGHIAINRAKGSRVSGKGLARWGLLSGYLSLVAAAFFLCVYLTYGLRHYLGS